MNTEFVRQETQKLNITRLELKDNQFLLTELIGIFKERNIANSFLLPQFLYKNKIVVLDKSGKYKFKHPEKPIHMKVVETFLSIKRN